MNVIRQGFRKLSSDRQTDIQIKLRVVTSGHVKDGGYTIGSPPHENPVAYADLMALSVIKPELWAIEVHIARIGISDLFCYCNLDHDLDFDPMTSIYELDLYLLEI